MASKRSSTKGAAKPARIDDLKLINGIGPAVEKRLNGVGIFSFAQLATLSPADIAAAVAGLAGLSAERIVKQDWISQAHKLAAESTSGEAQKEAMPSNELFHTATFTVELLLDENNKIQSTHVMHIQSRREHTWSDWPTAELIDFLSQSAGVVVAKPEQEPVLIKASKPPTSVATKPRLAGMLHLHDLRILSAGSSEPCRVLPHDQPVDVRLTLDLSEITVPCDIPLEYKVSIYRKSRSDPSGQIIAETEGPIKPVDTVTIDVEGTFLVVGSYRLAAIATLALSGTKPTSKPDITAAIDGYRIRVY